MKYSELEAYIEKCLNDAYDYGHNNRRFDAHIASYFIISKLEEKGLRPTREGFIKREVCDYEEETK